MIIPQVVHRLVAAPRFYFTVVAIGVLLRVVAAIRNSPGFDAYYYIAMGQAFSSGGEFLLPFGDYSTPTVLEPSYSHHFSPLWPAVLGIGIYVFGFSVALVKGISLILGIALLGVAYWATKDLYGKSCALAVTSVLAVLPELVFDVGRLYSENLTMILFILTIWAILRSLRDPRFMVLAGLFAGLAFLSRAAIGYFFILAGVAGFAWRFHFMRWRVFSDKGYLAGIAVFLAFVGGWSARNLSRFGWPRWETSAFINRIVAAALEGPVLYALFLVLTVLFFVILLLSFSLFFAPELRDSVRQVRREEESGLWLAVVLVPLIGAFIVAALARQGDRPVFDMDRFRYVVYAVYPLLLIGLRGIPMESATSGPPGASDTVREPPRRLTPGRAVVGGVAIGSLAFSALARVVWLVPPFLVAVPAAFARSLNLRLALLVVALLVVSTEVATSATVTASQAAVDYINAEPGPLVLAVDGPQILFYEVSYYATAAGIRVVDMGNVSTAVFVLSANLSVSVPGFAFDRIFNDASSEGIIQRLVFGLLGESADTQGEPLAVLRRT